jgi:dolichol-phosphate mannosyltransferase
MTYRALRAGLRVVEVPIVFIDRRVGQSKMDRRIFAEAVGVVWRLRLLALQGRI